MHHFTKQHLLAFVICVSLCTTTAAQSILPISPVGCLNPLQIRELREQYRPILEGSSTDFAMSVSMKMSNLTANWYLNLDRNRLEICNKKYSGEIPLKYDCANERAGVEAIERKLFVPLGKNFQRLDLESPLVYVAIEKLRAIREKYPLCSL